MSDTTLYTLKESISEQLHVFKSKKDTSGECLTVSKSVCNKMRYNETIKTHFACQSKTVAQIKCMEIGRVICETCKRHLHRD
ncbi:hypothetical protein [uncultured Kordia sp.]|uniref:hypothetical protein n=1 Tax=uncultured Kordia sp. TaxID=507699 RepID=UPI00260F92BC|nr:hypothetical protein [uncultured Kordia sp.]